MRDETIKIYLKLKQLMYEIDDIDESSDEEGNKPSKRESINRSEDSRICSCISYTVYDKQYMHTMACQRSTHFGTPLYTRGLRYLEIKPRVIL